MWARYCLLQWRDRRLVSRGWCWDRGYALEHFGFAIRRAGLTAVRLIDMHTGEILAAWEVAPASGESACAIGPARVEVE
jgi:hypothetical protein